MSLRKGRPVETPLPLRRWLTGLCPSSCERIRVIFVTMVSLLNGKTLVLTRLITDVLSANDP